MVMLQTHVCVCRSWNCSSKGRIMFWIILLLLYNMVLRIEAGSVCPLGSFPCGNITNVCVEQRHQCDGQADCENSADEDYFLCQDSEGWFIDFIEHTDNSGIKGHRNPNGDWQQEECVLEWYPTQCECQRGTYLRCDRSGMTRVPRNVSKMEDVQRLFLQENNIESIQNGDFDGYSMLEFLHLANNGLRELNNESFKGLRHLEKLFLEENALVEIKTGVFMDLCKVKWLFLTHNKIRHLWPEWAKGLTDLYWLGLGSNRLTTLTNTSFIGADAVTWLDLDKNQISSIDKDTLSPLRSVRMINLNRNRITQLHPETFSANLDIKDLDLSMNFIDDVPVNLFAPLSKLEKLNISHNSFRHLHTETLKSNLELTSLDLSGMVIDNINEESFSGLKQLKHIYFREFVYCSYAPHVPTCEPKSDGISTAEHLLSNPAHRIIIWVVAILTCVANVVVFIGRVIAKHDNESHFLCVKNLCASDFLMGVYLLFIGGADTRFRGHYNNNARAWMTSWACTLSGVLAMVSAEVSVLILTYMSLERYIRITNPYRIITMTRQQIIAIITAIWLTGLAIALAPLTSHDVFGNFYGSNGMCFPLHIHDPYMKGWEYSSFVFLGVNFIAICTIIFCYTGMFWAIHQTRASATNPTARTAVAAEMSFAQRFLLIVLSDFLCWFPVFVIKIVALSGVPIPARLYAWVSIFILPINSGLNPVLYSFSTVSFRRNVVRGAQQFFRKHFRFRKRCRPRGDQSDDSAQQNVKFHHLQLDSEPTVLLVFEHTIPTNNSQQQSSTNHGPSNNCGAGV